ncbi:MAG: polyprenyl synthetase family protein [Cyclobacteriaceae bacterium]
MSSIVQEIKAPIAKEMDLFEKQFRSSVKSNVFLLDKIMNYIVKRKGKQMRPMFVFLMAKLIGTINQSTHRGAALIELLHTATLVHDDVVDGSSHRRGFFSINALWKNKIAVLVGDYLLSRGLLLSVENGEYQSLKIVSKAVKEMSEGELLQMEKARFLNITEDSYYDIIRQKTASLIASCCAVGAETSGKSDDSIIDKAWAFGQDVGMAFQIKDDLFDYGDKAIGKPIGIDIQERKMTLPFIYAINNCSKSDKRKYSKLFKKKQKKKEEVDTIINFVKKEGGLEYAIEKMKTFHEKAKQYLNAFPESDSKHSLIKLIDYTISREK